MTVKNPFEYEEAKKLKDEEIVSLFIEDHNYTRMLLSSKNLFIRGERGSGKTMALLYSSFKIQFLKSQQNNVSVSLEKIGIYVPCNTPIEHKEEHLLLNEFKSALFLEHLLVINIAYELCNTLNFITETVISSLRLNHSLLLSEIEYTLGIDLPEDTNVFSALKRFLNKELISTQKNIINSRNNDVFYNNSFSFSSLIVPIIDLATSIDALADSHFVLMIDDAQLLKDKVVKSLNSWVAFRDHSKFSFKIATTKVDQPSLYTSFGGSILEGHDFIELDMEFYYDDNKTYEKISREIVKNRLATIGINRECEEFFPINASMEKDLQESKQRTKEYFLLENPDADSKKISDYVSRYYRVHYFRNRSAKANIPPYSGFETIVHLATGVIRNLLEPIYWMYDDMISQSDSDVIEFISPQVQAKIIEKRSSLLWEALQDGLEKNIEKCSSVESQRINNIFEKLSKLFKHRLLYNKSEPRALMFTISGYELYKEQLEPLLNIARQSRLLYVRMGNAKDDSKRELYYVPNKMLWPIKGLDPIGQHARVSLKAVDIYNAAFHNIDFPVKDQGDSNQTNLFIDGKTL